MLQLNRLITNYNSLMDLEEFFFLLHAQDGGGTLLLMVPYAKQTRLTS